jgi:hypothetical protein
MVRVLCPTLALALTLAVAPLAHAQATPAVRVELRENIPNPVTSSTTIAFEILPEVCARSHVPTVSLSIFNVLVQVVAIPVLEGSNPVPWKGVKLACGEHRAAWDGKQLDGRPATTGVYYYQLTVDGERFTRKLIVQRRQGEAA